ncbi:thiamine phosphate synthase [Arcticibacter eurypsychrophilus]|uniref:thiamine phosphate synthase n=1 Tax=Arcticibacter eurypsychrophilus TaxID=1434752 RepID=UPI00084D14A5|nr:thiamine phosphate synthase [Arcticibacter eurypsychrophilus]
MIDRFSSRLYLVVSEDACRGRDLVSVTEMAVKGGVDLVQIREKHKDFAAFQSVTSRLKEMLDQYGVPLIVNDNLAVALSCCASGIHVGNSDMLPAEIKKQWHDGFLLGYSIEYEEQLFNSQIQYTDYLGISPVFNTQTKTDTVTAWGLHGISKIRSLTNKPLVAIGNIHAKNAYDVMRAGADCLAVVSAICGAENPEQAAAEIRNQIEKAI